MTSYPWRVRHALSKEKKPIPGLTSRLIKAMILFDQIVEILALPQLTPFWNGSLRLQLLKSLWIGRVFVDRDDARNPRVATTYPFPEKALPTLRIPTRLH